MNKKIFEIIINLLKEDKISTEEFELLYSEFIKQQDVKEYSNPFCRNHICFCGGKCLKSKPDFTYVPETMPFYTTITCSTISENE